MKMAFINASKNLLMQYAVDKFVNSSIITKLSLKVFVAVYENTVW